MGCTTKIRNESLKWVVLTKIRNESLKWVVLTKIRNESLKWVVLIKNVKKTTTFIFPSLINIYNFLFNILLYDYDMFI